MCVRFLNIAYHAIPKLDDKNTKRVNLTLSSMLLFLAHISIDRALCHQYILRNRMRLGKRVPKIGDISAYYLAKRIQPCISTR